MHISGCGIALHTHYNVLYCAKIGQTYKKCWACTKISVLPLAHNSTMNSELTKGVAGDEVFEVRKLIVTGFCVNVRSDESTIP